MHCVVCAMEITMDSGGDAENIPFASGNINTIDHFELYFHAWS